MALENPGLPRPNLTMGEGLRDMVWMAQRTLMGYGLANAVASFADKALSNRAERTKVKARLERIAALALSDREPGAMRKIAALAEEGLEEIARLETGAYREDPGAEPDEEADHGG